MFVGRRKITSGERDIKDNREKKVIFFFFESSIWKGSGYPWIEDTAGWVMLGRSKSFSLRQWEWQLERLVSL